MLKIGDVCKNKGVTLQDLAKRIGITYQSLHASISGNPTVTRLQEIADILGVHVTELFDPPTSGISSGACPHCGKSVDIEIKIKPPGQ